MERIVSPSDGVVPHQLNWRITTCPRESGPAVRVRLVYRARGAPLIQSRQCLMSEGVVTGLNGLRDLERGMRYKAPYGYSIGRGRGVNTSQLDP